MKLTSRANLQIQKSPHEVYEAIVNPDLMTNYFISESTGRLEEGKEVAWKFPEFDDTFPIKNIQLNLNESISFIWDPETLVGITLKPFATNSTIVDVQEGRKELNQENLEWLISNTAGWANFLASMKAFLEYGIQLRTGAYDHMRV